MIPEYQSRLIEFFEKNHAPALLGKFNLEIQTKSSLGLAETHLVQNSRIGRKFIPVIVGQLEESEREQALYSLARYGAYVTNALRREVGNSKADSFLRSAEDYMKAKLNGEVLVSEFQRRSIDARY